MKRTTAIFLALAILISMMLFALPARAADEEVNTVQITGVGKWEVLSFDYKVSRAMDVDGEPASIPRMGKYRLRVKPSGNTEADVKLIDLAANVDLTPLEVVVTLVNKTNGKSIEKHKLKDAYCIGYKEYWDKSGTYVVDLVFVSAEYSNGAADYKANWI